MNTTSVRKTLEDSTCDLDRIDTILDDVSKRLNERESAADAESTTLRCALDLCRTALGLVIHHLDELHNGLEAQAA